MVYLKDQRQLEEVLLVYLHLVYLKACLRESFRLHYPVFGGSGRVMPEDTVFSGYRVPKGVIIND